MNVEILEFNPHFSSQHGIIKHRYFICLLTSRPTIFMRKLLNASCLSTNLYSFQVNDEKFNKEENPYEIISYG